VRGDTTLASFRRDYPLGVTDRVVVMDDAGKYAGIVLVAEAHTQGKDVPGKGTGTVLDLLHNADDVLTPQMTIKEAVALFEEAEADALAVVDSTENRRVIGLLTEQYALRRYSEELERRRRELSGE
jgi:CIC family chloride channel protein